MIRQQQVRQATQVVPLSLQSILNRLCRSQGLEHRLGPLLQQEPIERLQTRTGAAVLQPHSGSARAVDPVPSHRNRHSSGGQHRQLLMPAA